MAVCFHNIYGALADPIIKISFDAILPRRASDMGTGGILKYQYQHLRVI